MRRYLLVHLILALAILAALFFAARLYNNRGFDLRRQGSLDQAIADYDEAIRLDPTSAEAHYDRGVAYGKKGDLNKANRDFARAKQLPYKP